MDLDELLDDEKIMTAVRVLLGLADQSDDDRLEITLRYRGVPMIITVGEDYDQS